MADPFFNEKALRAAILSAGANGDRQQLSQLQRTAQQIQDAALRASLFAAAELKMRPALTQLIDFWCNDDKECVPRLTPKQQEAIQWFTKNHVRFLEGNTEKFEIKQGVWDDFCFVEVELGGGGNDSSSSDVKMHFRSTYNEVMTYAGDDDAGLRESVIEIVHALSPKAPERYGRKYEKYLGRYGSTVLFRVGAQFFAREECDTENTNFPEDAVRGIVKNLKCLAPLVLKRCLTEEEEEIEQHKRILRSSCLLDSSSSKNSKNSTSNNNDRDDDSSVSVEVWSQLLAVTLSASSLREDFTLSPRWAAGHIHELILRKEAQDEFRRRQSQGQHRSKK